MRLAVTSARVLLGLLFLVFGLNGFLHFIPQPPPPSAAAGAFFAAFAASHMLTLNAAVQAVAGALLLAGRFVPLALVMLTPIVAGILVYHLTYDAAGGVPGYVAALVLAFLLWAYRGHLMPLARPGAQPLVRA